MTTVEPEFLTVRQLAELLQIPVSTVYRWRHEGVAPQAIKVGKYVRFHRTDVETFIRQRRET